VQFGEDSRNGREFQFTEGEPIILCILIKLILPIIGVLKPRIIPNGPFGGIHKELLWDWLLTGC
jgi:hypothetical protein